MGRQLWNVLRVTMPGMRAVQYVPLHLVPHQLGATTDILQEALRLAAATDPALTSTVSECVPGDLTLASDVAGSGVYLQSRPLVHVAAYRGGLIGPRHRCEFHHQSCGSVHQEIKNASRQEAGLGATGGFCR